LSGVAPRAFVPEGELVETAEQLDRVAAVRGFLHPHGIQAFLLGLDEAPGGFVRVDERVDELHLVDVEQPIRVA